MGYHTTIDTHLVLPPKAQSMDNESELVNSAYDPTSRTYEQIFLIHKRNPERGRTFAQSTSQTHGLPWSRA